MQDIMDKILPGLKTSEELRERDFSRGNVTQEERTTRKRETDKSVKGAKRRKKCTSVRRSSTRSRSQQHSVRTSTTTSTTSATDDGCSGSLVIGRRRPGLQLRSRYFPVGGVCRDIRGKGIAGRRSKRKVHRVSTKKS